MTDGLDSTASKDGQNDGQGAANVDPSLSIDAAAQQFGVSARTVRRHIRDGTLHAFKRTTARGFEWRVYPGQSLSSDGQNDGQAVSIVVDNDGQQSPREARAPIVEVVPAASELHRLIGVIEHMQDEHAQAIERLERDNQRLLEDTERWQALALEAQAEVLRLLSAPQDDAPSGAEPTPAAAPRRPWWRQIFNR